MNKETLKKQTELGKKLGAAKKAFMRAQDSYNALLEKTTKPEAEKDYVGKFFVFRNGGAGGSWNLYWKVLKVENVWIVGSIKSIHLKLFAFEVHPDAYKSGTILRVSREEQFNAEMLGTEISEADFWKAWDDALAQMSAMAPRRQ